MKGLRMNSKRLVRGRENKMTGTIPEYEYDKYQIEFTTVLSKDTSSYTTEFEKIAKYVIKESFHVDVNTTTTYYSGVHKIDMFIIKEDSTNSNAKTSIVGFYKVGEKDKGNEAIIYFFVCNLKYQKDTNGKDTTTSEVDKIHIYRIHMNSIPNLQFYHNDNIIGMAISGKILFGSNTASNSFYIPSKSTLLEGIHMNIYKDKEITSYTLVGKPYSKGFN